MKPRPINARAPKSVAESGQDSPFRVFTNLADDGPPQLLIYDDIGEDMFGEGISAKAVKQFLDKHRGSDIDVRINSYGGDVYDGFQIFNTLASHQGQVIVTIEGIAFSAASFIAAAGDRLRMYKNSDFGIHRSGTLAYGNRNEMESVRDWLSTIDEHLADIYAAKTGQSVDQVNTWLDGKSNGTVFPAAEAVELGFADEVIDPKESRSNAASDRVARARARMSAANRMKIRELRSKVA